MPAMTSAGAAAVAAINSAPSSALSPHAAPFTLPSRPACTPPGRRQDGDGSFVVCAEDSGSPVAGVLAKSRSAVYPGSTYEMHAGQPSSWSGVCMDAYPSLPSVRITSLYKQQSTLASGIGSKCSAVKIERPPNKTSETNDYSSGLRSKLVTEKPKPDRDNRKDTSSPNLQVRNPVDSRGNSQGTMICSKEADPVLKVKPLHIRTTSADPYGFMADDVMPDPSECSVDSPCWRGVSPFDVLQTPATQSTNHGLKAVGAGQKQSSSTVPHYEAPSDLQNLVTSKTKHDYSQSHYEAPSDLQNLVTSKTKHDYSQSQTEASMSKKSGVISMEQTKVSRGKDLECANQYAAKCEIQQKHLLELRDKYVKRSGLNSDAPDYVPSSAGKPKIGKGPCSSTGRNKVLKAIENLTEMLQSSYSDDEIELEENEYILLESVIDRLQTCLHKTRKGPIKVASDKAGPRAPHSQTTVVKSDAGKYNGSYMADGGKGIINDHFAGSSHMLNEFGRNSLTRGQPSLNDVPKKMFCEVEHPQVLVYKKLWIEAERANCDLKYQLKHTCIKIDLDSGMAPIGECIQSGGNGAHSCSSRSKVYTNVPPNRHVLTGLEETATHRHAHPGLQLAPNRARQELNRGILDDALAPSYITGRGGILRSNSEYGSSDWEHVVPEEIGWS